MATYQTVIEFKRKRTQQNPDHFNREHIEEVNLFIGLLNEDFNYFSSKPDYEMFMEDDVLLVYSKQQVGFKKELNKLINIDDRDLL